MKQSRFFAFLLCFLFISGTALTLQAQETEETEEEITTSALLYEFDYDYDVVFKGIKQGLVDAGYEVSYASKRRNLIESAFKILAPKDDFFDIMEQYGKVPYVRSPSWKNGRTKVTVKLEETDEGKVVITVKAQLSAYEDRFLNKWYYWDSNGKIEEDAMDAIVAAVDAEGSASEL